MLCLLLCLSGTTVFADESKNKKAELKNATQLEKKSKSKESKDTKDSKNTKNSKDNKKEKKDKEDKQGKQNKANKNDKEPKPSNNLKKGQSNKTNTSKSNLDAYPKKMMGWYASMTVKNGCASHLATYKKTKQWPGLEITSQQVINHAEKLVCKPQKIKAMDGNFYVAESCKNEKKSTISRHLIYAKNNEQLGVSGDNKLQTFIECDMPKGGK